MTVLVVGGGGREHALVRKIKESPRVDSVHCCPGNGGIAYDAVCHNVAAMDIDGVVALAKEIKADLVVVAPDDPLVAGMVDALNAAGFATFGPRANAAIIEGSKVFSKDLMQKYHIPTAEYRVFDDPRAAIEYITEKNEFPTVIKADGLALGKGVLIPETLEEAVAGVKEIMEDKVFGASGNHIVVEEFLTGPEVSVLAFTDGKCVRPMVSSMDHKRALDGDKGLNTGGMGTVSPNPYYTEAVEQQCMDTIFLPTIAVIVPSILTRYGIIFSSGGNGEAKKSSVAHFNIWESLIDYVLSHTRAFFIGTGFGCEETGNILKYMYNLDKPHAHNFVIEFWVELGVVGIILLGILLIWSAGKLLEINTNNSRKLTLVFCVFTSLVLYLGFGLSDFIFNSPKQMIFLFLLLGLTQSISYCYDKTVITDARTLERAARKEIRNTLNQ